MQFFLVCSADSGSFSHEVKFYFICARDFHPGGCLRGKHLRELFYQGKKMSVFVAWEGCYCPQYTTKQVRYRVPTGTIYITTMAEQYFYKKRVSSLSNVISCERWEEIFKKSYFFLLIQWFVRRARRGNASGISLLTRRSDIIFRPAVRSRSCS